MKPLKRFFDLQTESIAGAGLILTGASFFSLILGLLRDRLLAGQFGLGDQLDIYYAAFKIPDFISMTFIIGAIGAAVIPIFSQCLVRSKQDAFDYFSNLLNLFLFSLVLIGIILFIFAPSLVPLIAPGFSEEKRDLTVRLTRIMLFSPVFLGLGNLVSGILRVFKRFLITSLAPIMYNLGIIAGILFLYPLFGIEGLAWGVVLGGAFHILIQLPILIKMGFRHKMIFSPLEPNFLKTLKLTLPRSLGLGASQTNIIVLTAIASMLGSGSIAALNLAESLIRPFLTLTGISFSTAAFPALSLSFSKQRPQRFRSVFLSTFYYILFLTIPLSIAIFLLRDVLVNVILRVGRFGLVDSRLTAACLGAFSIGLFAQGLVLLIAKAFYACQDTKTPALASIMAMFVNIFLCLVFVYLLSFQNSFSLFLIHLLNLEAIKDVRVVGLPLSISISSIFQFFFLLFFFLKTVKPYRLPSGQFTDKTG